MRPPRLAAGLLILLLRAGPAHAGETPLPQQGDYAAAMQRVAAHFHGRPGVVLHVGDSITYANPYGQWARFGEGRTEEDRKILAWMHAGADNDTDGWWLCRFDHPDGGRSHTAAGGLRADQLLTGGHNRLPPLRKILATYQPQLVVLMIGTNDVTANRKTADFRNGLQQCVDLMLDGGVICILSTIPPHVGRPALARDYNDAIRALARARSLPLVDYEREILKRRPNDWNGTLLGKGDVHPTAEQGGAKANSTPTAEHLGNSGYLLRGWLSVRKIAEVKRSVLDAPAPAAPAPPAPAQKAPPGEEVRVPVTRDTWFSGAGDEANCNLGGAPRLKLKSYQEMSLVDIDPKQLKGRVIQSAALHLRLAGDQPLRRVTVSSFAAEWVEGTSSSYAPRRAAPASMRAASPTRPGRFPAAT